MLSKKILSSYILALILALFGCIAGYAWYGIHDIEPEDTWKSLGAPPGQAVHLLAARDSTVYVKTTDNKIYSCYRESQYDRSCWKLVGAVPEDGLGQIQYPLQPPIPPIADTVLESLAVRYDTPGLADDGPHFFAYALLADGTVIQWISDPIGWFSPPILFSHFVQKTLGGACVGGLIGLFILIIWPKFRKSN